VIKESSLKSYEQRRIERSEERKTKQAFQFNVTQTTNNIMKKKKKNKDRLRHDLGIVEGN